VDPSFLSTLALPYNCVYSAAKLEQDPEFPSKTVMGSGPFVFGEHQAGAHWTGKRFDKYFEKGKPYLDGFRAVFIKSNAVVTALQGGQIMAEFRSISPGERGQLEASTVGAARTRSPRSPSSSRSADHCCRAPRWP
jgi:peptide/nickel transport system substrate-binding protein